MKKVLIALAAVVAIVLIGVGIFVWSIFGRTTSIEDGAEYGPVTVVADGFVSCYLVDVGAGKYALVDACNDPEGSAIRAALEARDASVDDVVAIFLTHGHSDHIGATRRFGNAQVFAHTDEIDLIEGRVTPKGALTKYQTDGPTAEVTGRLSHEQTVGVGNKRFESLHLPGHTAGSVAILVDGVLMLGDSGAAYPDDQLVPPPEVFTDDVEENVESLVALDAMLKKRDVEVILPAHSGPLTSVAVTAFAKQHGGGK